MLLFTAVICRSLANFLFLDPAMPIDRKERARRLKAIQKEKHAAFDSGV